MTFVFNPPITFLNNSLITFLSNLGTNSKILLGTIVAAMMAIDMGGPINKAAYVFGIASIESGNFYVNPARNPAISAPKNPAPLVFAKIPPTKPTTIAGLSAIPTAKDSMVRKLFKLKLQMEYISQKN